MSTGSRSAWHCGRYPAWQRLDAYSDLVETSRRRGRDEFEFEYDLLDTGVFGQGRYRDVFVEDELQSCGLFLVVAPWQVHAFSLDCRGRGGRS